MNYNNPIKTLVIEDELDAQNWLIERLTEFKEFEVLGATGHVDDAYQMIIDLQPEAIFLDNKLQGGNGINILERLKKNNQNIPQVIVTTGEDEYAVDYINNWSSVCKKYLMKPYASGWQQEIRDCVDILLSNRPQKNNNAFLENKEWVFLKQKGKWLRLNFEEVNWVETYPGVGVKFILNQKEITHYSSLIQIVSELPTDKIMQISRFQAVNIDKIVELDQTNNLVYIIYEGMKKELNVGDAFLGSLVDALPK